MMTTDDGFTVVFYGCFLVIEAHGGRCFRTPCPNCRAKPFKVLAPGVLAVAPRPRKKGRFRVAISDRMVERVVAGNGIRFRK